MNIGRICIGMLIGTVSASGWAETRTGIWSIFTASDTKSASGQPTNGLYWFDAQLRYTDIGTGANQLLLRPAIGWRLHPKAKVWLGGAVIETRNSSGRTSREYRVFQQVDWHAANFSGSNLAVRLRLLQRDSSTSNDLGHTLRSRISLSAPYSGLGASLIAVTVEPFWNLDSTDWAGDVGLTQNRTFLGATWKLREDLSLEFGYMHQYVKRTGSDNTASHLGIFNLKTRF